MANVSNKLQDLLDTAPAAKSVRLHVLLDKNALGDAVNDVRRILGVDLGAESNLDVSAFTGIAVVTTDLRHVKRLRHLSSVEWIDLEGTAEMSELLD